jgi:hypothetical protein
MAAAVLALVYLAILAALPKGVFWHPDEGGKFLQMASTSWDGGIHTHLRYGAASRDPELRYYPTRCAGSKVYPDVHDGTLQFQWPFWFPLATQPFYAAWGTTGLYVIPLLCGWLTALLSATWVRPYSRLLAASTILLVGLATPMAYYGFVFLEHTFATLLCMLGLWALCRRTRRWAATAVGFTALLAAAALRIEMMVFVVAVGTGWLVTRMSASSARTPTAATRAATWLYRRETWFLALAVVALTTVTLTFLTPRHWAALRELPEMLASTAHKRGFLFESLRQILINARGVGAAQVTVGAETLALVSLFACLLAPFVAGRRWEGWLLLIALALLIEVSFVITLLSYAYAARQGLFAVAPFLAIALYALPPAWHGKDPALRCLAVTGLVYFAGFLALLFTTRVGYSGDYLIGLEGAARYVLVFYPVWVPLSVIALHFYRASDRPPLVRSGVTLLILMAVGLSVTYQARGILALNTNRQVFARWSEALPTNQPLVTSEWWLGAAMARHFIQHEMYCVKPGAGLAEWVAFAQAHGIERFTFAVRRGIEPPASVAIGLPLVVESDGQIEGLQMTQLRVQPPDDPRRTFQLDGSASR